MPARCWVLYMKNTGHVGVDPALVKLRGTQPFKKIILSSQLWEVQWRTAQILTFRHVYSLVIICRLLSITSLSGILTINYRFNRSGLETETPGFPRCLGKMHWRAFCWGAASAGRRICLAFLSVWRASPGQHPAPLRWGAGHRALSERGAPSETLRPSLQTHHGLSW